MTTSCSEQVGVIFIIARDSLRNSIFESKLRHWSTTKLIGGTRVSPSWWNMSENYFRNLFKPFRSIFLLSFLPKGYVTRKFKKIIFVRGEIVYLFMLESVFISLLKEDIWIVLI